MKKRFPLLALLALAASLFIAACGDDDSDATVDADPAAAIDSGEETASSEASLEGEFVVVAEEGFEDVAGVATQERTADGATTSLEISGLDPETDYISHVHAGACDQEDPGGPHYKFDLNGGDTPPNEIHLAFTTDADGAGTATADSAAIPDGEGLTVVVHEQGDSGHSGHSDEKHSDEGHSEEEHSGGDKGHFDSEHSDEGHSDKEKGHSEKEKGHSGEGHSDKGDEDTEHGDEKGGHDHSGHSHAPKIACADLS